MKKPPKSPQKVASASKKASWNLAAPAFFIPAAILLTWMVYSACSSFGITNWDDNHYLRELLLIRSLDWDNIVRMFTTKVLLSYNPLTILSLAIDYQYGENSTAWYHGMNVFLHVVDTVLLYAVIRKLFKLDLLAAVVALLFAMHPMHVEAVAWIACRKDVLYVFFFLSAWLAYLKYIDFQGEKLNLRFLWYGISFLLFLASGFSKIQAITFPLALILTDYFRAGTWSWKSLPDKIPFFIGSLCFGGYAVLSSSLAADQYAEPVTFVERIIYSFQAFSLYAIKSLLPFSQSAIHPFPLPGTTDYWLLLITGVILTGLMIRAVITYRKTSPGFVFGLVFFLVNIFPTLHVVGLNSSLIYERFTYLSYIGMFISFAFFPYPKTWPVARKAGILLLFVLPFSYISYQRTLVWKSSLSLWNDVIEKFPNSHEARNNRGAYYNERGEVDLALADFNVSLQVNPRQPRAFNNRSMIWFKKQDYRRSIQDVDSALFMEPKLAEAWCNRGNAYFGMQKYDTAIINYDRAIKSMPNFPSVYSNRGSAFLKKGDYKKALDDYNISVRQDPNNVDGWRLMALAFAELGKDDSALIAAQRANSLNPNSNAFVNLSEQYVEMGVKYWYPTQGTVKRDISDIGPAIALFEKALSVNPSNSYALEELGGMYYIRKDIAKAREFWKKALAIDPKAERSKQGLASTGGF